MPVLCLHGAERSSSDPPIPLRQTGRAPHWSAWTLVFGDSSSSLSIVDAAAAAAAAEKPRSPQWTARRLAQGVLRPATPGGGVVGPTYLDARPINRMQASAHSFLAAVAALAAASCRRSAAAAADAACLHVYTVRDSSSSAVAAVSTASTTRASVLAASSAEWRLAGWQ